MNYIKTDKNNFGELKRKLNEDQKIVQYVYASIHPEFYSLVQKRGVYMGNNFHLKLKEWKYKTNIHKNQLIDTFQSFKIHNHPNVQYRKNLSRIRTLRKKKNCRRTKTESDLREKTKKENINVKMRQNTKNLNELRKWKKMKGTEKKCGLGSKNLIITLKK